CAGLSEWTPTIMTPLARGTSGGPLRASVCRTDARTSVGYDERRRCGTTTTPAHSRSFDPSSLHAVSKMSDVLRRQRLSADSPVTALRFFNDDHGFVPKAFALDTDERIGDLFNHLLFLGVAENPFDHLDVGKWHLNAPFEVCCRARQSDSRSG